MGFEVEILPDAAAVARRGAEVVAETAAAAIDEHGRFTFAVSGGHTPWAMFAELPETLAWDSVSLFQVDERVAPDGDPDRNLTHLLESLPADAGADVRAMPVGADDLDTAAAEYAASLPDAFDLVHLGLGPDGHTASLVPGDPVLDMADRDVAATGVYQGRRRMTLTYPVLNRARRILWLVTGEDKVDALRRLRDGDRSIPGGRVSREQALVVADAAAAGLRRMSERRYPVEPRAPAVLTVDVGGSHVKAVLNGIDERRRFVSGEKLTGKQMVDGVLELTTDWDYTQVSVGLPAPVVGGRVLHDPVNLGKGWTTLDYERAFGKPTKVINDAAMQAFGSYEGGRMLFLGLGTGLGSTMILEGTIAPMELGHLPFRKSTFEDYVGERGRERLGNKHWRKAVLETIERLTAGLLPDYVVIGGGNAERLDDELPADCRLGHNEAAFLGGFRLWIDQA